MTTTFDAAFLADAWPALVDEFGRVATYYARGSGSGSAVTVIFLLNRTLPQYVATGEQIGETAVVKASADDIATPHLDDTFALNGETWAVVDIGRVSPLVEFQVERRSQRNVGQQSGRVTR